MPDFVLDIETISPNKRPTEPHNFLEPEYFEVFAVALGERRPDTNKVNPTLLFREDDTARSEWKLISNTMDWLQEKVENPENHRIFTYNGEAFDFVHLRGRAEILEETLGEEGLVNKVRDTIERMQHVDLHNPAWEEYGDYTTLDETCEELGIDSGSVLIEAYNHGMNPCDWRDQTNVGRAEVFNQDIPVLGEQYLHLKTKSELTDEETTHLDELETMIEQYALHDIEPLFKIADGILDAN